MKFPIWSFLAVVIVSLLAACSDKPSDAASLASAQARAKAKTLNPQDPQLAAIYQRSCKSCHGIGVANIPQAGDMAAWQPRLAKGMDGLMDSVINGFGGMPPLGMCMDCQPEEFEALINFMAGQESSSAAEAQ